jgi:hypothetical protein
VGACGELGLGRIEDEPGTTLAEAEEVDMPVDTHSGAAHG